MKLHVTALLQLFALVVVAKLSMASVAKLATRGQLQVAAAPECYKPEASAELDASGIGSLRVMKDKKKLTITWPGWIKLQAPSMKTGAATAAKLPCTIKNYQAAASNTCDGVLQQVFGAAAGKNNKLIKEVVIKDGTMKVTFNVDDTKAVYSKYTFVPC
mmetsp:Transcript_1269/g.2669  ORF Transcript_1269/g.2669 Transcript_1269/m.2669 type:complete len:159 (-) Transcript_1269:16-492(-)